jgi:hypothetical protein
VYVTFDLVSALYVNITRYVVPAYDIVVTPTHKTQQHKQGQRTTYKYEQTTTQRKGIHIVECRMVRVTNNYGIRRLIGFINT